MTPIEFTNRINDGGLPSTLRSQSPDTFGRPPPLRMEQTRNISSHQQSTMARKCKYASQLKKALRENGYPASVGLQEARKSMSVQSGNYRNNSNKGPENG